jgi:hypothetical protein
MATARLRPYGNNARTHSKQQIRQIAASIKEFGFTNPVLIGDDDEIIAGHGRVEAAKLLGWHEVPTVRLSHLTATQRRAYVLADNKLALSACWDHDVLADELAALLDVDFDVEIAGFSPIEFVADDSQTHSSRRDDRFSPQVVAESGPAAIATRHGDMWLLDGQRLLCAHPCNRESFEQLIEGDCCDLVIAFTPAGCDRIVRQFEQATGRQATLASSGESFAAVAQQRSIADGSNYR